MELTVYTTPWCSDCREAKRFLDKHKIAYKEIDIENDPAAAAEVVKKHRGDLAALRESVRLGVRRVATRWTGKKPVVDVLVIEA